MAGNSSNIPDCIQVIIFLLNGHPSNICDMIHMTFVIDSMKTQVTFLIVPILRQPSVSGKVAEHCLMSRGHHPIHPAALEVQRLQANPLQERPDLPLVDAELHIPERQPWILRSLLRHGTGALHG